MGLAEKLFSVLSSESFGFLSSLNMIRNNNTTTNEIAAGMSQIEVQL